MDKSLRLLSLLNVFFILICSHLLPNERYYQLDNSLKIVLKENHKLPVLHVALAVDVGSKDETDQTSGLVHLLEHLILMADTQSLSSEHIIGNMRKRGIIFNGHTGFDHMVFDMTLPPDQMDTGLDLLKRKIFQTLPTEAQLDGEKSIILEELKRSQDDPAQLGLHLTLQFLFQDHPYSRFIGGRPDVIKKLTLEKIVSFCHTYFVPANCCLAVYGDFSIDHAQKLLAAHFGSIPKKTIPIRNIGIISPLKKNVDHRITMDTNQAHLMMGLIVPEKNHRDKAAMDLLAHILGKGPSPMIRNALRYKRKLIKRLSSRYISQRYGGGYIIHLTMDPRHVKAAKSRLLNFLKKTGSIPYDPSDLHPNARRNAVNHIDVARNLINFRSQQFHEQGNQMAQFYAGYYLTYTEPQDDKPEEKKKKIRSKDLRRIAAKYLGRQKHVFVSILPPGESK